MKTKILLLTLLLFAAIAPHAQCPNAGGDISYETIQGLTIGSFSQATPLTRQASSLDYTSDTFSFTVGTLVSAEIINGYPDTSDGEPIRWDDQYSAWYQDSNGNYQLLAEIWGITGVPQADASGSDCDGGYLYAGPFIPLNFAAPADTGYYTFAFVVSYGGLDGAGCHGNGFTPVFTSPCQPFEWGSAQFFTGHITNPPTGGVLHKNNQAELTKGATVRNLHFKDQPVSTDNPTGGDNAFTLYPNPTANLLHITTTESGTLLLYDIAGRLLIAKPAQPGENSMDISAFPSGIYLVAINGHASKFVKL